MSLLRVKYVCIFFVLVSFFSVGINSVYAKCDYADRWKTAKGEFKRMFKKKPAETVNLFITKYHKKSGLGKALRNLDKMCEKAGNSASAEVISDYQKALDNYKAKRKGYLDKLNSAKKEDAGYEDMIVFLKKSSKAIENDAEGAIKFLQANAGPMSKVRAQAKPTLKKVLNVAEAFISKVEANRKKSDQSGMEVYTKEYEGAARGVTTALQQCIMAGMDKGKVADGLITRLKPWANDKAKTPKNAQDFDTYFNEFKGLINESKDYMKSLAD